MPQRLFGQQNLRAACVIGPDRFCIAVHAMQADDPFTILLQYNGAFSQPWTRIDVKRNIAAIAAWARDGSDQPFVALSDEGDVYLLTDPVVVEKIPGAGIYSADADGSGALGGLAVLDGSLHACGARGQLYRRTGADAWTRVSIDAAAIARQGRLDRLAEGATGAAYAIGTLIPEFWEPPAELEAAQLQAAQAGDLARFEALSIEAENWAREQGLGGVTSGFLLAGSDGAWRRVETGSEEELRDILVEPSGEVWAVGTNGVILNGDPVTGTLTDRSRPGDRGRDFVGITRFEGRMVLCSDSALHWFDGQILTPMRPMPGLGIDWGTPVPLTMRAVGHGLVYFDRAHGVHRFDGSSWQEIEIPVALLQRDFVGPQS